MNSNGSLNWFSQRFFKRRCESDVGHRTCRDDRGHNERGAILILALIYILTISLIVVALSTWATNDLNNSTKFSNARSTDYAATNATELAIQSIRYTALVNSNQTLNAIPPSYCWGTTAPSVLTTNNVSITVWCSTVMNLKSANTRAVTFSACLSTVSKTSCASNPLLQAVVIYDDYPKGGGAFLITPCSLSCGTYATLQNWNWGSTAGVASGLNANAITITSPAPPNAAIGGSYRPAATATSLDVVVIASATPGVCTMSSGVVSFVTSGSCTVNFDDSGNAFFSPATEVQQTFSVVLAANSITITSSAPSNATVGGAVYTPSATATSLDYVPITSATTGVCTISSGDVSFVGAGICTLHFNDPGNSNYAAAAQTQQTFNVSSYSGNNTTNVPASPGLYLLINGTSAGSSTSTANGLVIGTATTLTGLTMTISGNPSAATQTATVGIISGGVWTATALTCSIIANSNQTVCTSNAAVSISAGSTINIRGIGNALHTFSWVITYTQP